MPVHSKGIACRRALRARIRSETKHTALQSVLTWRVRATHLTQSAAGDIVVPAGRRDQKPEERCKHGCPHRSEQVTDRVSAIAVATGLRLYAHQYLAFLV